MEVVGGLDLCGGRTGRQQVEEAAKRSSRDEPPVEPAPSKEPKREVEALEKGAPDLVVTQLPRKLWVAWRQVEDAGWDVPSETWTSVCGWPFSRNSSKVVLNSQLTMAQRKCKKCTRKTCGVTSEGGNASPMNEMSVG